jgi:hypothetical protein
VPVHLGRVSLMRFTIDMLDGPDSLWFYWPMLDSGLGVLVIGTVMGGVVMGGVGGPFGAGRKRRQVEKYLERRSGPNAPP